MRGGPVRRHPLRSINSSNDGCRNGRRRLAYPVRMRHRAASALPFLASLLLTGTPAAAQSDRIASGARAPLQQTIRTWRQAHDVAILRELTDFVAISNIATDVANIRRNAAHLVTLLESRGFRTQLLQASGGPPAVFGELRVPAPRGR